MKKRYCKNCKYGLINWWGYEECWLKPEYNKLDFKSTYYIAKRETLTHRLNKKNNCKYYKRKHWWKFWV